MKAKDRLKMASSRLRLGDKAKDGVWMVLVDPYGEAIGLALKVRSTDSSAHQRERTKAVEQYQRKSEAWKKKNMRRIVGAFQAQRVVLDWWSYDPEEVDDDGEYFVDANKPKGEDKYDPKLLGDLLGGVNEEDPETSANNLIEQIDLFTSDPSNFRADPDLGKSETTSSAKSD